MLPPNPTTKKLLEDQQLLQRFDKECWDDTDYEHPSDLQAEYTRAMELVIAEFPEAFGIGG